MNKIRTIQFSTDYRDFATLLNKRVGEYFRSRNISRHGNAEMFLKTMFMFTLYLLPYTLVLSGVVTGVLGYLAVVAFMSIGLAGIGLSVMHDANHGAYSNKKWVNQALGYSLNLVGANAFNWKIQHNVLHHSYTNVHEEDEDISPRGVLRLSPHSSWKSIHRFQFVYAWPLYGLMTIVWLFYKDFVRIIRYHKNGMAIKQHANIAAEWIILVISKLVYVGYIIVLPVLFTDLVWWQVLVGVVVMHYIAGFILAIIFQPAHVVEGTEYPLPDEDNKLQDNWAVHQLRTTMNFASKSRLFSWYVGGLNYQIEHHLFPNICHVHYRRLSAIVEQTASEFGLPYRSLPTFREALVGHARQLKLLGMKPVPVI
jgi:linoleoyl-CoA desaturase